jgi:hypothetical protein
MARLSSLPNTLQSNLPIKNRLALALQFLRENPDESQPPRYVYIRLRRRGLSDRHGSEKGRGRIVLHMEAITRSYALINTKL